MKKVLAVIFMLVLISSLCGCLEQEDGEYIGAPSSSDDCEGTNYKVVENKFKDAGFNNIVLEKDEDLIIGFLSGEGDVEEIMIDGNSDFEKDEAFKKDSLVRIIYHAFPNEDDTSSKKESDSSSDNQKNSSSKSKSESTSETKDDGKIKTPLSSDDCEDENYKDIKKKFEKAGFTNIKTKKDEDLIIGLLSSENDVESISVDGKTSFEKGAKFDKDVKIVITYHAYPEEEKEETKKETKSKESTKKEYPDIFEPKDPWNLTEEEEEWYLAILDKQQEEIKKEYCPDSGANRFINRYNQLWTDQQISTDNISWEETGAGWKTTIILKTCTLIYSYADYDDTLTIINNSPFSGNADDYFNDVFNILKAQYKYSYHDQQINECLNHLKNVDNEIYDLDGTMISYELNGTHSNEYNTDYYIYVYSKFY